MSNIVNFGKDNASLVVEVSGDAFLPQQVRRIVGTALAISHGWLPDDVWDTHLLNPIFMGETILAPADRLYLSDIRFHFEESRTSGQLLFDTDVCGKVTEKSQGENAIKWAQQNILNKTRSTTAAIRSERIWLKKVEETISPRIKSLLLSSDNLPEFNSQYQHGLSVPPKEYEKVLEKLRYIVKQGLWPVTSVARSTVIKSKASEQQQDKLTGKSGSFTVINTNKLDQLGMPMGNQKQSQIKLGRLRRRLTAVLYCRMISRIGDLNQRTVLLTAMPNSLRMSTVAVELDKASQLLWASVTTRGGQLMVEGNAFDIGYKPVEFDGWNLRHWTLQFKGERFSLVWFTLQNK
jgi:hypothetical protein